MKECPMYLIASVIAFGNDNSNIDCTGERCAWYDDEKCAVVGLVEQLWFLRKDIGVK